MAKENANQGKKLKMSYKNMTEKEYNDTKRALEFYKTFSLKGKATPVSEVSKLQNRTPAVVKLIDDTSSFAEYRAVRTREYDERKNGKLNLAQIPEAAPEQPKPSTETTPLQGDKVVKLLEQIYTEMKLLRTDLRNQNKVSMPEKRGMFNRG